MQLTGNATDGIHVHGRFTGAASALNIGAAGSQDKNIYSAASATEVSCDNSILFNTTTKQSMYRWLQRTSETVLGQINSCAKKICRTRRGFARSALPRPFLGKPDSAINKRDPAFKRDFVCTVALALFTAIQHKATGSCDTPKSSAHHRDKKIVKGSLLMIGNCRRNQSRRGCKRRQSL